MPTFQEIPPTFRELPRETPSAATGPGPQPTFTIPKYDPSKTYMDGDLVSDGKGNVYSCIEPALAGDGLSGGGWGPVCIDYSPDDSPTSAWGDSVRNPDEDLDDDAMQLARAFASRSSDSGGTLHGKVMDLLNDAYSMIEPIGGWGHI